MELGEALIARLLGDAAVSALVGTRVYWVERPQGSALPALVLRQVGRVQDDPLKGEADFAESRVQADSLAATHERAWALDRAVRAALKDEAQVGDVAFWEADASGPIDLGERWPDGFVHRAVSDYLLRHSAGS